MKLKWKVFALLVIFGLATGVAYGLHPCTDDWFCACSSPIIIDVGGNGIELTDAVNGVLFDIKGNGKLIKLAWTKPGSKNAWLALDRNGNGMIDNGKELFGNFTDQPDCEDPNGFLALAEFDKTTNGGNGDGEIDAADALFSSLRLWIDNNHNGISEPGELFALTALGVDSISLDYKESAKRDRYGNRFRYRARVNQDVPLRGGDVGHFAYDVFLATQPQTPSVTTSEPPGTINGAQHPELIPTDVAYEIFLRVASCSDDDPEIYKKKCRLVHKAVGLEPEDANQLSLDLEGFHSQISALDDQTADLRRSKDPNHEAKQAAIAQQRQIMVSNKIAGLQHRLTQEGARKLDAYIQSMKAKIKFTPKTAPKVSEGGAL